MGETVIEGPRRFCLVSIENNKTNDLTKTIRVCYLLFAILLK